MDVCKVYVRSNNIENRSQVYYGIIYSSKIIIIKLKYYNFNFNNIKDYNVYKYNYLPTRFRWKDNFILERDF